MDYGRSFTFPFKDPDWIMKFVVGGLFALLSCILVGIPFLLGYAIEVIRNTIAGRDEVLPAWDNLGDKFMQGLVLALVIFVLSLPASLVGGCSSVVLNALAASANTDAIATLAGLIGLLITLVVSLYGLVIGVALPAVYLRYTVTRSFGESLKPSAIWAVMRANLGQYIVVILISYAASIVASFGTIACVIGVFVTMFWAALVQAHLLGQYYRSYVAAGAPPVADSYTPPAF